MADSELHPHPRLSPVFVDQVIDHLKDDPKALAACSLVSRAWVQRSYYHRFEKLAVSSASSRRIVAFGNNNTLPHIRMMMIIGDWNSKSKAEMPRALAILRAHSAPSTLILESANLITNAAGSITRSLPISVVETLRLSNCNVHKSTMVFDILSALPRLNRLILHHIKVGQADGSAPPNPLSRYTLREPHQLSSIEVASNTLAPYLEPLELVAPQLKLHSLNLGILHVPDTRRAGKFIKTCTSLRDFTMTVAFLPSDFATLGFPALTNLQSLHLIMSPPDLSTLLTFISNLLWNLPSVHMESITLKFLPIYDTAKKSVKKPSKPPPTLPLLKKLHIAFNFDSDVDHDWVTGLLKKQFASYCKRGILQVEG